MGPKISLIEAGKTILKMKKCRLRRFGISFLPPFGCYIAPRYFSLL